MKSLIFVYGTLLFDEPRHSVLADSIGLGAVRTEPQYSLYDLGVFPALVERGNTSITGEIYLVDAKVREELDRIESHPRFYERKPVVIQPGNRRFSNVESYFLPGHLLARCERKLIPTGDWRKRNP